jgi:hypothetical protein
LHPIRTTYEKRSQTQGPIAMLPGHNQRKILGWCKGKVISLALNFDQFGLPRRQGLRVHVRRAGHPDHGGGGVAGQSAGDKVGNGLT